VSALGSASVRFTALTALLAACGSHEPRQSAPEAAAPLPQRCALRLVRGRILVDGEPVARTTALERCKRHGEALVYIDDESLCGEWSAIESDFQRSRVRIYVSGPLDDTNGSWRVRVNGKAQEWKPLPRPCREPDRSARDVDFRRRPVAPLGETEEVKVVQPPEPAGQ